MNTLDRHFHRAQQLIKAGALSRKPARQRAAAPMFYELTAGDGAMYDTPTYIRNRIQQFDFDNRSRVVAYTDRVRAMLRGAA